MRPNDLSQLEHTVAKINDARQTPTRADILSLLMLLRDSAPKNSMLQDLGHSVAHEERDRGHSFIYLEKFTQGMRRSVIGGGDIVVEVMFPIRDILREMNQTLDKLGVKERFDPQDDRVLNLMPLLIGSALDGTKYALTVASGTLVAYLDEDGSPSYHFQIVFHDDIYQVGRTDIVFSFPWMVN